MFLFKSNKSSSEQRGGPSSSTQTEYISKFVLSFLKYETRKRKHNEKKDWDRRKQQEWIEEKEKRKRDNMNEYV